MFESEFSLIIVFLSGIVTALLPCTLPVIVGYLGYLIGVQKQTVLRIVSLSILFFVGFAAIYTLFGVIAGIFGTLSSVSLFINQIKPFLVIAGGIVLVVFGFLMLRILPLPGPLKQLRSIKIPQENSSWWFPILLGGIFATAWSPCIGPVLGSVLLLAGSSGSVLMGGLHLFVFSLGIGVPLILISFFYGLVIQKISSFGKIGKVLNIMGGLFLVLFGVLFITGHIGYFAQLPGPFADSLYGLFDITK